MYGISQGRIDILFISPVGLQKSFWERLKDLNLAWLEQDTNFSSFSDAWVVEAELNGLIIEKMSGKTLIFTSEFPLTSKVGGL